ncbi:MAG: GTPase ObgE [Verrucomicrobia bacterium]|nr:GTPase ObgE [Verrucomicrobiota bacterium]
MFVDEITIKVKAGDGGNGCMSFRREAFVPLGGPDGGNGGNGGDVVLVADENVDDLIAFKFKPHLTGTRGRHGKGKQMTGARGKPAVASVPCGTLVRDAATGELLADLVEHGERCIVAKGGKGGRGNTAFKSPTNRAPRQVEKGAPGEEREVALELKVIADIGLVGFPNAGKSSFLAATCDARPRIAAYPFTTLAPNLGVLKASPGDMLIKVADIPGLVEGAHEGRGLGHQFLRHIERTHVLLFMLDTAAVDGRDPIEDFRALREELAAHDPALAAKPYLVACNKMDLDESQENYEAFRTGKTARKQLIFPISCHTRAGLDAITDALVRCAVEARQESRKARPRARTPAGHVAPDATTGLGRSESGR